jgi:hypothetical protein
MTNSLGPHQRYSSGTPREDFACKLFDLLWSEYRARVTHVQRYEEVLAKVGATFFNDHIALRSIAGSYRSSSGTEMAHLFNALGYRPAGHYAFENKHLDAIHYQHDNPKFPKIFISELRSWEFPPEVRKLLPLDAPKSHLDSSFLADIYNLNERSTLDDANRLIAQAKGLFAAPAEPIDESTLEQLNEASQYAAWVLLHGSSVNHFTSLVNSHQSVELDSIDKTVERLLEAGVPMKDAIEGAVGSKLRQTATAAVEVEVAVLRDGVVVQRPWTYAYFELAERGMIQGEDGRSQRFEGFLGSQATELFEMTRR